MVNCIFCGGGVFIVDSCVLQTFRTYLRENPISCSGCNLKIPHNNCVYVYHTGTVISKLLVNQVNHHEIFVEYYEIFKRQGHVSISMNTFFKTCRDLVRDPEFISQLIPNIIAEQFSVEKSLNMCLEQYILDMQGFKISAHEFIMREFCILACDGSVLFHCLVKLPCEMSELTLGYQKQVEWLTQNFHNLSWDTKNGYSITHIRRMISLLCKSKARIYCKGTEKVQWVKKLFHLENVFDIGEKECPALKTLNFETSMRKCTYHDPVQVNACALRNCFQLQYWLKNEKHTLVETLGSMQL